MRQRHVDDVAAGQVSEPARDELRPKLITVLADFLQVAHRSQGLHDAVDGGNAAAHEFGQFVHVQVALVGVEQFQDAQAALKGWNDVVQVFG